MNCTPTPTLSEAMALSVTVPVEDPTPPTTLLGFKVSEETVGRGGGVTVSEADRVAPPKDAEMVTVVDAAGTILRIDLRDYQWNEKVWDAILALNPYGEAQYYAAHDLQQIFRTGQADETLLPEAKDHAIRGYQAVLDFFPDTVTYDASGKIPMSLATMSLQGILALGGTPQNGWALVKGEDGLDHSLFGKPVLEAVLQAASRAAPLRPPLAVRYPPP